MRQVLNSRRSLRRLTLGIAMGLSLLCLVPMAAHAQSFPSKPVHLVVTYPAGGSSDLMARIMGQKLSEYWKQPVIIESKPGAAGSIGMNTQRARRRTATPL